MDTTKPVISGNAAKIVGGLGTLLAAVSPLLPAVGGVSLSIPAAVVGFILAALAGLSVAAPNVTEGKPILQGAALSVATAVLTLLVQFWPSVPAGWPQSAALAVAAVLAWLTGHALPKLGSPSQAPITDAEASADVSKADALKELGK